MQVQLQVRASAIHARGCFAVDCIPAGTIVREYVGERIPAAEAVRREKDAARPGIYTLWLDDETAIDGWHGGNESIYLNHACQPNCDWHFEGADAYIVAVRDIAAGEELTIDYAYEPDGPLEPCACGTDGCRGFINDVV